MLWGEMRDCAVEESFDSVHGGLVSGVSERTMFGFEGVNCTFVGVRREKGSYGVRRVRGNEGKENMCEEMPESSTMEGSPTIYAFLWFSGLPCGKSS